MQPTYFMFYVLSFGSNLRQVTARRETFSLSKQRQIKGDVSLLWLFDAAIKSSITSIAETTTRLPVIQALSALFCCSYENNLRLLPSRQYRCLRLSVKYSTLTQSRSVHHPCIQMNLLNRTHLLPGFSSIDKIDRITTYLV